MGEFLQCHVPGALPRDRPERDQPDAARRTLGRRHLYRVQALSPKVWKHVAQIGGEQLFVFTTTVLATLTTDLLWGIAAGMLAKLALEIWISARVVRVDGHASVSQRLLSRAAQAGELFRDPVIQSVATPAGYHLYFARPLVCFNTLYLNEALARIPSGATAVYLHVTDMVTLIDHTATTTLLDFVEDFKRGGKGIVEILGLDRLRPRSHASSCMRISPPIRAEERAEALVALARLSLLSEDHGSTTRLPSLTHLGLASSDRSIEESPDHPITELLTNTGRLIFGKMRDLFASVRAASGEIGRDFPNTRRDLIWYSLDGPAMMNRKPGGDLDIFSLTKPNQRPKGRSNAAGPDISMIWGTWTGDH